MTPKDPGGGQSPTDLVSPPTEAERQSAHYYKVSSANLGVALVSLAYPPLAPLVIGGVMYTSIPMLKRAVGTLFREGKITNDVLSALSLGILWVTGHHVLMATDAWLYHLAGQIVTAARGKSKKVLYDMVGQLPQSTWVVRDETEVQTPPGADSGK